MQKSIARKEYAVLLDHLREVREQVGVTQVELASRLEGTQTFISKCERGERRLDLIELRDWCRALGISLDEFVRGVETRLDGLKRNRSRR
ncbi:MAG: helix-turn-helix transcriptional regulator [Acidobacteria bacterium]|jgi:transcriptional regulator with XRE-family HTH domain|nr:helix-turn-helix transcriptional regulator [Acidobacteriota bacterium]